MIMGMDHSYKCKFYLLMWVILELIQEELATSLRSQTCKPGIIIWYNKYYRRIIIYRKGLGEFGGGSLVLGVEENIRIIHRGDVEK